MCYNGGKIACRGAIAGTEDSMKTVYKPKDRDFVILNLTDIHMDDAKMEAENPHLRILHTTLQTLFERTSPDLITITGDLAWGGHHVGQAHLISLLDREQVPYAPVMGNHDHETDEKEMQVFEAMLGADPLCLYEAGDSALGHGNYAVMIKEEGSEKPLLGLIFMDSHNRMEYQTQAGETVNDWAHLTRAQLDFYLAQVKEMQEMGCAQSALFLHIPIRGYEEAFRAAFRTDLDPASAPLEGESEAFTADYSAARGRQGEGVCCPPIDDGMLEAIVKSGHTRHVFCGHDHRNNWRIPYRGVNLVYCLKTGSAAYWDAFLNGGTVICVGDEGIKQVRNEYVTIDQALVRLV